MQTPRRTPDASVRAAREHDVDFRETPDAPRESPEGLRGGVMERARPCANVSSDGRQMFQSSG